MLTEQQLIDDFFNEINDEKKVNTLKSNLGEIKKFKNPAFIENQLNSEFTTLFIPKMEFKYYLEYRDKFKQAENLLSKLTALVEKKDPRATHDMSISGSIYKTMIQSALNSWIVVGYKNEIEAVISALTK